MNGERMYQDVQLYIDGVWRAALDGKSAPVLNPATGEQIGTFAYAGESDLAQAVEAARKGFQAWRKISALERYRVMRKAADLLRSRLEDVAAILTTEEGKPMAEARIEVTNSCDFIDWFAEEGRRAYGWTIPSRFEGMLHLAVKEPVGPVAAFTPWNFPISQSVRKIAPALAAGCSIIHKGAEQTPASTAELVRAFADAGVPAGVVNLVYGDPAKISAYLIPHPSIRKVTFTGSIAVGKRLAALAGQHMKRVTMELGGHAPAVVFEDADIEATVKLLMISKYRNAGQVCTAPSRFLVHDSVYDKFVDMFTEASRALKVGDGADASSQMGPLAHAGRIDAMEAFVADARKRGARVKTGGSRIGNKGFFFEPTVLTNLSTEALILNEEPFGPIATMLPFSRFDDAVTEANRLDYGLAAYAFTRSSRTVTAIGAALESGMVAINSATFALPETPIGGVKDSGYGSEGGREAIEAYFNTKYIAQAGA
jgi:succinate-semialdehyde dehydrogenase/glutarate-semialdehyde dehydrogenase